MLYMRVKATATRNDPEPVIPNAQFARAVT